ncbi:MAG: hypothetical protein JXA36_06640, partial [Coriobacteriia bacterium]|nr:hypothetical protein [Coriobacteriia bacterium]
PEIALRLGLSEQAATDAALLVREHLLLSAIATTRDLSDEDVVFSAAARVGRRELVEPLFLLTAADMTATGPNVWTPWRRSLIAELARKMDSALSPGTDGAGIVASANATRDETRRLALSAGASRTVIDFIETAPLRYLSRAVPEEVLRNARLVQTLSGPGSFGRIVFGVRPASIEDTWHVDIATRDRPGLFATIGGAIALAGLSTLAAEAFTARGIALDTFTVTSATRAPVDTANWSLLERLLDAAASGRLDIATRLAERSRHYSRASRNYMPPLRIDFDPPGEYSTTVRVQTADRVGLLHDLARAFESEGMDIRRANVSTLEGTALDVFEITDAQGEPPQPDLLGRLLIPRLESAALA